MLELATADSADGEDYEDVLLQRGTADSYADFIDASEKDLKQAYGCLLYTSGTVSKPASCAA